MTFPELSPPVTVLTGVGIGAALGALLIWFAVPQMPSEIVSGPPVELPVEAGPPRLPDILPEGPTRADNLPDPGEEFAKLGLYAEAIAYWRAQAQEHGDVDAAYRLGQIYLEGDEGFLEHDYAEAHEWLEAAANHGDIRAANALGRIYDRALGVERDPIEAARQYRTAAERGLAEAQYNLARMLAKGEGAEMNEVEALMWFKLAQFQGFEGEAPKTADAIAALEKSLTPEQVEEADTRARDFAPVTQ